MGWWWPWDGPIQSQCQQVSPGSPAAVWCNFHRISCCSGSPGVIFRVPRCLMQHFTNYHHCPVSPVIWDLRQPESQDVTSESVTIDIEPNMCTTSSFWWNWNEGQLKQPLEPSQSCEGSPLLLLAGNLHWFHPENEIIGRLIDWEVELLVIWVKICRFFVNFSCISGPNLCLCCIHFHFLRCDLWVTWKSSWWSASDTIGSSLSSSSTESLQNPP